MLVTLGCGHGPAEDLPPTLTSGWNGEPVTGIALLIGALLYGLGLRARWRRGARLGVPVNVVAAFGAGWLVLAVALAGPLAGLGRWLLSAQMAQHMLLLALAPPLLLLGRPGSVWRAALPAAWARGVRRPLQRVAGTRIWPMGVTPTGAMLLQAAVMWSWHLPAANLLAMGHPAVHHLMRASFLGAGLLFWAALFRTLREPVQGVGAGVLAIVGTMIHMGLLSALLTFAGEPRFGYYLERAPAAGLLPLEDQQLAGLIMWVPSALPYLVGGLVLTAAWLTGVERREAAPATPGASPAVARPGSSTPGRCEASAGDVRHPASN